MGEVFLAEHINLGRKEALKILQPSLAAEPEFAARFRREARATNRVQHPNIVSVFDFGQLPDGRLLLAMEYVEGEGLSALIRRIGRLPVSRALNVLIQLASAVDHAHSRGVVHRDLKPENMILVEHRGQPDVLKVLDFGIAKIVAPDYKSHGLTKKGEVFGTPAYMPPEQFAGQAADPRSDLYAIGVIAFELLVGEPPFSGRTMELMHAHLTKIPDLPSQRRPEARIPPELDALVRRCLEKDPARRFQSGNDLRRALEQVPGYAAKKPGSGRRQRRDDFEFESNADVTWAESVDGRVVVEELLATGVPVEIPDDGRRHFQQAVRELAEACLDLGQKDVRLIVALADFKEIEQDLAFHDIELQDIERRMLDLEQSARERAGALRFALGELNFDRTSGPVPLNDEAAKEIRRIEVRIAKITSDTERELVVLQDRSIAIAAARSVTEEKLDQGYAALERVLKDVAPPFAKYPEVARQLAHLGSLNDAGWKSIAAKVRA